MILRWVCWDSVLAEGQTLRIINDVPMELYMLPLAIRARYSDKQPMALLAASWRNSEWMVWVCVCVRVCVYTQWFTRTRSSVMSYHEGFKHMLLFIMSREKKTPSGYSFKQTNKQVTTNLHLYFNYVHTNLRECLSATYWDLQISKWSPKQWYNNMSWISWPPATSA